jgi:hypothetical protein
MNGYEYLTRSRGRYGDVAELVHPTFGTGNDE